MYKTVYILGAGSSISHTKGIYPNIKQIFRKAWDLHITTKNDKSVNPKYRELNDYLKTTFNYSISDKYKKLDYEKVFTFVEIENQKDPLKFGSLRKNLLEILDQVFMKLKDHPEIKMASEYKRFLDGLNPYDTIITFNWDVLLDDFLGRKECIKINFEYKSDCDDNENTSSLNHYRNFCELLKRDETYYNDISNRQKNGFFLKLHGSVDWHTCTNSSCVYFKRIFPTLFPLQNRICRRCLEPTQTWIIPPTLQKSFFPLPLISEQWNFAKEEIIKADKIVIWGYSLPPTDFNTEWLIRQTRKSTKDKIIYIININEKDTLRIEKLFSRQKNIKLIKKFKNFSEFLSEFSNWQEK